MKIIIALLLTISAAVSAHEWTNFHVKWNHRLLDPTRSNSFFEIPRTLHDARSAGWVQEKGLDSRHVSVYCYPNDGQLCILLDGHGYIAGFQVGMLASDVEPTGDIYQIADFDMYQNKTMFGEKYVTSTIYTVNPEIIRAGGRRDWNELMGTEGIWIGTTHGYLAIPRHAAHLDTAWKIQNCIEDMGVHYYYNMDSDLACKDFLPWFLLYQDGELTGVGLQSFGRCTVKDRSWCEGIPALAIKSTIPDAPECLIDLAGERGIISMHFYFTSTPWNISC